MQSCNQRKRQSRILAGTAAQDLRHRCHHLSRLQEGQDATGRGLVPVTMQRPAGSMSMSYANNMYQALCEKRFPFRHGLLLSEIGAESISKLPPGRLSPLILTWMDTLHSPRFCKMTISFPSDS